MVKKYSKILILTIILFFIFLTPSFAKEMSLSELGKEIEDKYGGYYAYVIGDYVFTSEYPALTTQDIMLAARSIKTDKTGETSSDPIYEEMTIHEIRQEWEGDKPVWKVKNNLVGESTLNIDKMNVRYIDYNFYPEKSKAEINVNIDDDLVCKEVLEQTYNFKTEESYGKDKLKLENGKLSGLLLKNKNLKFKDQEKYKDINYFFAYALDVPDGIAYKTTIKITFLDKTNTITYTNNLAILMPVDHTKWLENENNRKMTIVVDVDGDDGKEYEPTTYTIDLSGLTFQEDSKAELKLNNANAKDKEILDKWGYKSDLNKDLQFTADNELTTKLTGKLVEQYLTSEKAFGESNKDGYYFDFTFDLPDGVDTSKVKISQLAGENNNTVNKTFQESEYDENGNLTVLFRFPPNTTQGSKLYYSVDLDGEGEEYLPTIYTIDCSEVTFVKSSLFEVQGLDKTSDNSKFTDDGWLTDEDYSVEIVQDAHNPNKYNLSGILPLFEDNEWEDNDDPLNSDQKNYYLGLKLKLTNAPEGFYDEDDKMSIKFLDSTGDDKNYQEVIGEDFGTSQTLYILKYLNPYEASKEFKIKVDLDGDGEKFAEYTVTIDYNSLKFQNISLDDVDYDIIHEDNLTEGSKEKEELDSYGYNYKTDDEVKIKIDKDSQPDREPSKQGLEGKIKEQTLTSGFKNNTGYFVPIKISFPKEEYLDEYKDKWTLTLYDEEGNKKLYIPEEEYDQGWVLVLFRIDNTKTDENAVIKFEMDFDGDEKAYLPCEYTIPYKELEFLTENKITYQYKDNDGVDQEIEETVYEGEEVTLKDLGKDTTYRTFDGWYKDSEESTEKVETKTITTSENEDVTLTAHWNLKVEEFVEAVVNVNSTDKTYSDNFSGKFSLTQKENAITINVDGANVPLTELANTSIPGTIAYILQKGEIKDITLTVGSQTVQFNSGYKAENGKKYDSSAKRDNKLLTEEGTALKEEIIKGAKDVFDKELDNKEADATLDQLEYKDKTFTIKIGNVDKTVKLVDSKGNDLSQNETKKTYTFNFDSEFVVVDQDDNLGATDIKTALENEKAYKTVYIDGNITATDTINITADHDVNIKPVENVGEVSLASENPTTITVTGKDSVINVQSGEEEGTVTISDLKLTGGTKAELTVETGAKVIANNLDVSGIKKAGDEETNFNAGIIVKGGTLTASNITNNDESYDVPTIRIPKDSIGSEVKVTDDSQNKMTKITNYRKIKQINGKDDEMTSTNDICYYLKNENSLVYCVRFKDDLNKQAGHVFTLIKWYFPGQSIDTKEIEEFRKKFEETNANDLKNYQFVGWFAGTYYDLGKAPENGGITDFSNETLRDVIYYAGYKNKPSATVSIQDVDGISKNGDKISGTIKTQSSDGKFYLPVILTSENFQEGKSIVKVTDPNGKVETYTYSSSSNNGIATVSNANTMNLQLEAIKSSKITGNNGKIYKIAVDVDGKDGNEYQEETYTIDYSEVETLEEKINKAAENTQNANNLKFTKNNSIKGHKENFTIEYDKKARREYFKEGDLEAYIFLKKEIITGAQSDLSIYASRKVNEVQEKERVYLNNWKYCSTLKTGYGINELSLLQDLIKDKTVITEAINRIVKVDDTYEITINEERLKSWLNELYLNTEEGKGTDGKVSEQSGVKLIVTLIDNDTHIGSIKTSTNFSITDSNNVITNDNSINVTIENVETTKVKSPQEMLAKEDGTQATIEELKDFIEKGEQWWSKHTGSTKGGN